MTSHERVTFTGGGGEQLAGLLDLPAGDPTAYALFAHCFTCSKNSPAAVRISAALTDSGIAVLRFDFTGLGESGGDFGAATFSSNVADLVLAAGLLRERYAAPSLMIGHSLGGAAVLAAAGSVPEVAAVVTVGAPADPAHVTNLFSASLDDIARAGRADVRLGGRTFCVRREFLDDIQGQAQADRIAALRRPLLVLHAPEDETVGVDNARLIYDAARHPKSFIALDGANHLLTGPRQAARAAELIAAWVQPYLPEPTSGPDDGLPAPLEPGLVVVQENGRGPFGQTVRSGRHTWDADEPLSVPDALDTGPGPYDLLLAGLGACTSMTMRMYTRRKGWPLERVTVSLRHSRIHARDCEACESKEGRVSEIKREIRIDGDLDTGQREALMQIADRCPVHQTLHGEVVVVTNEAMALGAGDADDPIMAGR